MKSAFRIVSSLALLATWSACSSTVAGDKDVDGQGTGTDGGDGDTGVDASSGGTGDISGAGGAASASGGAASGGAASGGADGNETMTTCGATMYPTPTQGAWGCMDFDDEWPPTAPWSLTNDGVLQLKQDRLTSAPNSMQLNLSGSAATDAGVAWRDVAGDDVEEVRLEFELHANSLSAVPQHWDAPLSIACIDFGRFEACLAYQWGATPRYTIQMRNYMSVETTESYSVTAEPVADSWDHVVLTMNNQGEVTVRIEGKDLETFQGPGSLTDTAAIAWVGQFGPAGPKPGYFPHFDDIFVSLKREQ